MGHTPGTAGALLGFCWSQRGEGEGGLAAPQCISGIGMRAAGSLTSLSLNPLNCKVGITPPGPQGYCEAEIS